MARTTKTTTTIVTPTPPNTNKITSAKNGAITTTDSSIFSWPVVAIITWLIFQAGGAGLAVVAAAIPDNVSLVKILAGVAGGLTVIAGVLLGAFNNFYAVNKNVVEETDRVANAVIKATNDEKESLLDEQTEYQKELAALRTKYRIRGQGVTTPRVSTTPATSQPTRNDRLMRSVSTTSIEPKKRRIVSSSTPRERLDVDEAEATTIPVPPVIVGDRIVHDANEAPTDVHVETPEPQTTTRESRKISEKRVEKGIKRYLGLAGSNANSPILSTRGRNNNIEYGDDRIV